MNTKFVLKVCAMSMLLLSLGLQAFALLVVLYEIFTTGHFGLSAAISYGAIQVLSIPALITAVALVYFSGMQLPMKWVYAWYMGSHLVIWMCLLAFPGKFAI